MQANERQPMLSFPMDTVAPVTPVPIFYLHDGAHPFCPNPRCLCHVGEAHLRELLHGVLDRSYRLREVHSGLVEWEVR
jgi:hypothetical protein